MTDRYTSLYELRPREVMNWRLPVLCFVALACFASGEENAAADVGGFLESARSRGIITEEQESQLLSLAGELAHLFPQQDGAAADSYDGAAAKEPSVFMRVYGHLTLLNVLYFFGALLIMGAYTLFMTLAWEACKGGGIAVVMLFQIVLFGSIGALLWISSEDYQYLGGILCSISTGMVPFAVYNLQRALNAFPKDNPGVFQDFSVYIRPGWLIMEGATIIVGLGFLQVVAFPFLLFPVSFAIWFLSMDLAPLFPEWYSSWQGMWEIRRQLSVAFGVLMMLAGYVLEISMGSDPDFGFWLYLFGLISFWFALTLQFPEYDIHASLYLLMNVSLGLVGSHLDRTTFHVFSTVGVSVYVYGVLSNHVKSEGWIVVWLLKAVAATALFAQAFKREGNLEILGSLVCVLAFNFDAIRFVASGKVYQVITLLTNLGFISVASAFNRPLDLWLFTLSNTGSIIAFVSSFTLVLYHARLPMNYWAKRPTTATDFGFHAYRFAASILLSFVFVFLRQPSYAWIGALGIPLIAVNFSEALRQFVNHRSSGGRHPNPTWYNVVSYSVLLFGVVFSKFLQSNLLYLICCLCMLVVVLGLLNKRKVLGCFLSVLLVFFSVPLHSKFMISIGCIYLFFYLTHLAYDKFRNSLLFPLALTFIGILLIYCGIMYQRAEHEIYGWYDSNKPAVLRSLLDEDIITVLYPLGRLDFCHHLQLSRLSVSSFLEKPLNWLLWSGALFQALARGSSPQIACVCGVAVLLLVAIASFMKVRQRYIHHLDRAVTASSIKFSLSQDEAHDKHGLVIDVKGTKPASLAAPLHLALDISGPGFWRIAGSVFGEWAAGVGRSMFLPYKLTPHLMTFSRFEKGSTDFTARILLGTGHKGSHKMKHSTLTGVVAKLTRANLHVTMDCVVLYSKAWYQPYSKLCVKAIDLKTIENQISQYKEDFSSGQLRRNSS